MNRIKNIIILLFIIIFALLSLNSKIKLDCIFKKIFKISCPACGLTRSIRALLKLDIKSSFNYNIFGILLFVLSIVWIIYLIIDIIKNEDKTIKYTYKILGKYYYIIIMCLIISMIVNNIRGI